MDLTKALNDLSQIVRLTDNVSGMSADKLNRVYEAAQEMMRASAEYLVRATVAEEQVRALLAIISHDDGETQVKYGTQRTVIDAIIMLQAWRLELGRDQGVDPTSAKPKP